MYRPVVLIVLDGWGLSNSVSGNPIRLADLPTFAKLDQYYPMTALQASGISVGLPWNTAGNSEVGHMTMGAGRVIYQNMPRISLAIQDGSFYSNPVLLGAIDHARKHGGKVHLMGLVSSGSVHSHKDHILALCELANRQEWKDLYIHAFTDGRDSPPNSGLQQLKELQREMRLVGTGTIASLSGRHYAMDRNNNWERIEETYRMLTQGVAEPVSDPLIALERSYAQNITDEYIVPVNIAPEGKTPVLIDDNDAVIFFNFREDRARELTKAFVLDPFEGFERPKKDLYFVTMTEYEQHLPVKIAFPLEDIRNSLGEVLSAKGKKQLRIAETEKYAHVTYFFNGGKEKPFEGEDRILVPSPTVPHFDEVPEMSAPKVTETLLEKVKEGTYDFILVNYANPDMVGHTGNEEASIEAVEATDKSLSLLIPELLKIGAAVIITSDHGNVEEVKQSTTGEIDTEHSTNPIPLWFVTPENQREKSTEEISEEQNEVKGLLSDVAPTVLELMGIQKPPEMNGTSLLPLLK